MNTSTPCLPDCEVIRNLQAMHAMVANPVTRDAIGDLVTAIRNDMDSETLAYQDALDAYAGHILARSERGELDARARMENGL